MAEVIGVTHARALEIERASISSGRIDPISGRLILTRRDGGSTDAGLVRAPRDIIVMTSTRAFSKEDYPSATSFRFQLWGAGGSGGDANTENPGGGGGGGGYAEVTLLPDELDYSTTVYIGSGGYNGEPGGSTDFTFNGMTFGAGGGGGGTTGATRGDQFGGGGGGGMDHVGYPANGESATLNLSSGSGGGRSAPSGVTGPGSQAGVSAIASHHGASGSWGPLDGGDAWYGGGGGNSGGSLYGGGGGGAGATYITSTSSSINASEGGYSRMGGDGGRGGSMNVGGYRGIAPGGGGGGAGYGSNHAQGGRGADGACIVTIYYS